ncbi:exodeoxyribonuclease VII small subunit [Actinotalea sp.]|uniref:exodeoxyribonuclease VII small subunit n=1 Tax=Actinotalea sp. TaxID=1872145 RepID=UPI002CF67A68|nr:exodeoxyribonuclease VII small subunit [Actinotalea sp.]HQY34360.1 exodeoxyribonuclease VII small subunit [Actinotalea sp.]HRA50326.1 exodeoxyribonuclease VII small subunit [Actinotalea sp.]
MTYEQARDELVGVVARLEAGGETLEGSLALWERGEALAARCQEWLDGARRRLDAARSATPDGPAPGAASTTTRTTTRTTSTAPAPTDPEDDR